jgi:hypothetical protein
MKDRAEDIIRQKINNLENFEDGNSIDTDKLWLRLNRKIDNKPAKRKQFTIYWLAAASVLIIVFVTLLPKQSSKKNAMVQIDSATSSPYPSPIAGNQDCRFSREDMDPPGLHAKPVMPGYNVKIEDNLLCY